MKLNYEDDIVYARFINYMKKALLHKKINYIKQQNYLRKKEKEFNENEVDTLSKNNIFASFLIYDNKKIDNILNCLSYKQRLVISKYYLEDKTTTEIAKELKTNENTIYQIKYRAIKKIKRIYK